MPLAIRRDDGYFVEPTPVTLPEHVAHKDAPALPPLPESIMAQVAHPSPPRIPWPFIVSFIINALLLALLVRHGFGR